MSRKGRPRSESYRWLQIGDRLTDETGEYEVIGRPYATAVGKNETVRATASM